MSSLIVPSRTNLILGCGYLGRRVARLWLAGGQPVAALTRRNGDELAALGIEPVRGDVLEPESLRGLPEAETVLYAVGLDRTSGRSMREVYIQGLGNVLDGLKSCRRVIYVSSTSVYGQSDGGIVDERSPTEPFEESGRIVLEAERLLRQKRPDAVVLRLAGIYGPDRLLRRQGQLQSGEPIAGDPERWLNLIHVADGARAILAAESRGLPGETYNIVDDEPATRRAFYTRLAELTGSPPPKFEERQSDDRANNRRVNNAKARAALGWLPGYPSFREGLPAALRRIDDVIRSRGAPCAECSLPVSHSRLRCPLRATTSRTIPHAKGDRRRMDSALRWRNDVRVEDRWPVTRCKDGVLVSSGEGQTKIAGATIDIGPFANLMLSRLIGTGGVEADLVCRRDMARHSLNREVSIHPWCSKHSLFRSSAKTAIPTECRRQSGRKVAHERTGSPRTPKYLGIDCHATDAKITS